MAEQRAISAPLRIADHLRFLNGGWDIAMELWDEGLDNTAELRESLMDNWPSTREQYHWLLAYEAHGLVAEQNVQALQQFRDRYKREHVQVAQVIENDDVLPEEPSRAHLDLVARMYGPDASPSSTHSSLQLASVSGSQRIRHGSTSAKTLESS